MVELETKGDPLPLQRISLTLLWCLVACLAGYFVITEAMPLIPVTHAEYTDYYWARRGWLFAHAIVGTLAIITGPVQFATRALGKMAVHRAVGYVYAGLVLAGAISAVALGMTAPVGQWLYLAGTVLVSAYWLASTGTAIVTARRRLIDAHRRWAVRSYATTLFFTLFFTFYRLLFSLGWPQERWEDALALATWLGFILPTLAVEIALRAWTPAPWPALMRAKRLRADRA